MSAGQHVNLAGGWRPVPGYPAYEYRDDGALRCWRLGGTGPQLSQPVPKSPVRWGGEQLYRLFDGHGVGSAWLTADELAAPARGEAVAESEAPR